MNCYTSLAGGYDSLTEDVQYEKRAAFLQKLLAKSTIPVHTVLDLACGTGTMTCLLAEAGYEMIGVDISEDMLSEAAGKTVSPGKIPPIYLQQSMEELDLYGSCGVLPGQHKLFDGCTRPETDAAAASSLCGARRRLSF